MKILNNIAKTLIVGHLVALGACTDNFESYNENKNSFPEELQEIDFQKQKIPFKVIQRGIIYQTGVDGTNWQYQIMQNLVADMYSGYFHDMVGAFNNQNSSYNLNTGWCAAQWDYTYAQVMPSIKTAEELTAEDTFAAFNAVAKIIKVAAMHRVSDYYGPIVYSTFGTANVTSESQSDAYNAFFADLDYAVTTLNKYIDNGGTDTFEDTDMMMPVGYRTYSQWVKFANSLRLRLAMRVSNVNATLARQQATAALASSAGGVLETAAETVGEYGVANPLGGVANWWEVYMNASMEPFLNGYEAPRMDKFYKKADGGGDVGVPYLFDIKGLYKGIRQGTNTTNSNRYSMHSWTTVTPETPIIVMTAAEVWFLRAEAALRVYTSENVHTCYETGIATSFSQWGVSDAYTAYLSNENEPREYIDAFDTKFNATPRTKVSPKFDPAGSNEQKLEQIITQKWLAIYPEGCEAWAERRRTGYPQIFQVAENLSGGLIDTQVMIRRVPFPQGYISSDPTLYNTLLQQLGGADNGGTRLWWDAGQNNF